LLPKLKTLLKYFLWVIKKLLLSNVCVPYDCMISCVCQHVYFRMIRYVHDFMCASVYAYDFM
jgi:hypothetical protein